jgi:hypothetical protein
MRHEIEADFFAKGVVVLAVFKRSFRDNWIEEAKKVLAPTGEYRLALTVKGFKALLELAIAIYLARSQSAPLAAPLSWIAETAENGYCHGPLHDEYSVAIVPVMWGKMPENIISAGAGDICSGITLLFGW